VLSPVKSMTAFFGQGPLSRGLPAQWTTATYSWTTARVIIGDDGPVKNQGTLAMTFLWVLVGTDIIIQKVHVPPAPAGGEGYDMRDSQPSEVRRRYSLSVVTHWHSRPPCQLG